LGHPDQALRNWRLACQAADTDVPVISRLLPAADTRGDPRFEETDAVDEPAPPSAPHAASGVYVQDETDADAMPVAAPAPEPPASSPVASVSANTEDDYFDTAPLPVVDMTQTSDHVAC